MKIDEPVKLPFGFHKVVDMAIKGLIFFLFLLFGVCLLIWFWSGTFGPRHELKEAKEKNQIRLQYLAQALDGTVEKPIKENGYPLLTVGSSGLTVWKSLDETVNYHFEMIDGICHFSRNNKPNGESNQSGDDNSE